MAKTIYELHLKKDNPTVTDEMLIGTKHIRSLDIDKEIVQLPIGAFSNCKELKKIYFEPNSSLRKLPDYSFSNCQNLSKISHFPKNLVSINDYAFLNCTSIHEFDIPESVEFVSKTSFDGWKPEQTIICHKPIDFSPACRAKIVKAYEFQDEKERSNEILEEDGYYFYIVRAKCGHVGRQHYIPVDFPIKAKDAKEAAFLAKKMARVKRDHKDAIINVKQVSKESYLKQIEINQHDPYLCIKTAHEQDKIVDMIKDRFVEDPHYIPKKNKKRLPLKKSDTSKDFKEKKIKELTKS